MTYIQSEYTKEYNKNNYKMYQFRIKKNNHKLINYLDSLTNKNSVIVSLLENELNKQHVYTIKQIKDIIKPILSKHNIHEVYLFGSYARGEATPNSDVDILCEKGTIKTYLDQGALEDELQNALNKEVDILFTDSVMDTYFKSQIEKDLIKLC